MPSERATLKRLDLPDVLDRFCYKAGLILTCALKSAQSMLDAFETEREERGRPRGMTTDDEQDLLRAMLVMAAAGLDAMTKQLIRDTLPALARQDSNVRKGLEEFIVRQFRGENEGGGAGKFLARVLSAASSQQQVIEEYILSLTGSSLQSVDELLRAANALGFSPKMLDVDPQKLREVFTIRNKIIHELDMDLEAEKRVRNLRGRQDMMRHTEALFRLGRNLCCAVSDKLKTHLTSGRVRLRNPALPFPPSAVR